VVGLATVVPGGLTPARADSGCTTTTGVTVIVDFKALGGGIQRGCALNPTSGLDALRDAGFIPAGTTRFGDAYVCRIDGKPGNPPEACTETPPATAYWAYYHAKPTDGAWTYAALSALYYKPQPGSIEGWAFGARTQPGISPANAIPPPTTVPPPPPPPPPPTTVKQGGGGHVTPTTRRSTGGSDSGGKTSPGTLPTPGATTAHDGAVAPPATFADGTPVPTTAATPAAKAKAEASAKAKAAKEAKQKPASKKNGGDAANDADDGKIVERAAVGTPVSDTSGGGGSPLAAALTVVIIGVGAAVSVVLVRKRRLQSP
jgi:hypothetical protein